MKLQLPPAWIPALQDTGAAAHLANLSLFLEEERSLGKKVFPEPQRIFQALHDVAPEQTRVVILGQDPYHGEGQAIGRSFAVPNPLKPKPPSLKNIFKELETDLGLTPSPMESDLGGWAKQGVMLLNTVLTVRADTPLSHQGRGWEEFTDSVLKALAQQERHIAFVFWGAHAQKKKTLIGSSRHAAFESAHPSPLSARRGFFGSKVFSRINEHLVSNGEKPIDWSRVS